MPRTTHADTAPKAKQNRSSARQSNTVGLAVAIVGCAISGYLFATNPDPKTFEAYRLTNNGLCLWVPLVVILLFFRDDPRDFGLTAGDRKQGLLWAGGLWLAMLPLVVFASTKHAFSDTYLRHYLGQWMQGLGIVFDGRTVNLHALWYYELMMGFYMFCWEFFFRGFLLFGLARSRVGEIGAIVLQAVPFVLLHWSNVPGASKPLLEVAGSLPAALILGYVALRTRSFFYGFLAHWAVSVSLDLVLLRPFIFHRLG